MSCHAFLSDSGFSHCIDYMLLSDVVEELIKEEIEDEVDMGYSASMRPAEMIEAREEYRYTVQYAIHVFTFEDMAHQTIVYVYRQNRVTLYT